MKRLLIGVVLMAACLACSGCLVLATVAAVGAVAATTVKTTGKVAVATVKTTRHVASVAVSAPVAPATPAALTTDSAARLAHAGLVVVVDGGNGAATNLPWQEGMTLAAAAGKSGSFSAANIFRGTRVLPADLRQAWTAELALLAGDVVELRH